MKDDTAPRAARWNRATMGAACVLAGATLLAGCGALGLDDDDQVERLERAEARWRAQGHDSYSFVLRRLCYCPGPHQVVVEVTGGTVTALHPIPPGEELTPEVRPHYPSVEGLFDIVRDAIRSADDLQVEYDPATGAPTRISIDYIREAVDDELAFQVSGVAPGGAVEPSGDETADQARLTTWAAALQAAAGTACTSLDQCRYTPYGAKACGGPWGYLVYSTAAVDEGPFLAEVGRFTVFSARLNAHYGWGSDCSLPAPPRLGVRGGRCVDLNNGS